MDVLANDFRGITFIKAPEITAVSESRAGGTVRIGEHGMFVVYTPPANFIGQDHFTYPVDGGPVGEVTVHVIGRDQQPEPPGGRDPDMIDLQLKITNEAGDPIRAIELGQTFYVEVYVDDLRRTCRRRLKEYSAPISIWNSIRHWHKLLARLNTTIPIQTGNPAP